MNTAPTVKNIQAAVGAWSRQNFQDQMCKGGPCIGVPLHQLSPVLGLCEEYGELLDSINDPEATIDALGDIGIYLCDYASRAGFCLETTLDEAEATVAAHDNHPIHTIGRNIALLQRGELKRAQGIRGFNDHGVYNKNQMAAIADLWQGLCKAATMRSEFTYPEILANVAAKVTKRDWVKDPKNAAEAADVSSLPEGVS